MYGLTGLGVYAAMSGDKSDKKVASEQVDPKQSASSKEEAAFLENFINDRGALMPPTVAVAREGRRADSLPRRVHSVTILLRLVLRICPP